MMHVSDSVKSEKTLYDTMSDRTSTLYKLAQENIAEVEKVPVGAGYQPSESDTKNLIKFTKKDKDGRTHEVWKDERYNVFTYILHGNEDDKKNGLLGTDGTAVVKIFNEGSYDYLKVDDFIDRAKLLIEAGIHIAENLEINAEVKGELLAWLKGYKSIIIGKLTRDANFDGLVDNVRTDSTGFNEKFKMAVEHLQQAIVDVSTSIGNAVSTSEQREVKTADMVKELQQAEIAVVTNRGRPFIIKVGDIEGSEKLVSSQFPLGSQTIPSSDRTGSHAVKLSNHVRDASGILTRDGRIQIKSLIDGHSSYPPIGVEGSSAKNIEIKKRFIAYQAALEKVSQLASDILAANPDQAWPITISLSTMMILTPALGKKPEAILRGDESEHGQLADTRYALEMLKHTKQPMTLVINGKPVSVKVDVSYMNFPVNIGKRLQKLTSTTLQDVINARGFDDLSCSMNTHLALLQGDKRYESIQPQLDMLARYYSNSEMFPDKYDEKITEMRAKLDQFMADNQSTLEDLYEALQHTMKASIDEPDNKYLIVQYDSVREKIKAIQDKVDAMTLKISNYQTEIFQKKYASSIHKDTITALIETLALPDVANNPLLKEALLTHLRFLRAEDLYHNKKYLHADNAYQFHVNYLLANEGIGRYIEAFCKSAEDRTGWLRVSLLANLAFTQVHGRPPEMENVNDKKLYNKCYSAAALELSASIENTKYNSEARSLQVKGDFTNKDYNIDAGKAMSTLAKAIFKHITQTPRSVFVSSIEATASSGRLTRRPPKHPLIRQVSKIFDRSSRKIRPSNTSGSSLQRTPTISATVVPPSPVITIPDKIDRADLDPTSGKLLSDSIIEVIKSAIANKELGGSKPARLSKKQIKALLDIDIPYSIITMPQEDGSHRIFAVYKGVKQNKHMAEGGFSTIKYAQDLDSKEFFAVKLQVQDTSKQKSAQEEELRYMQRVGQALGAVAYRRESGITPTLSSKRGQTKKGSIINLFIMPIIPGKEPKPMVAENMNPSDTFKMAQAALQAVNELHEKYRMLHCDIKFENMIYDPVSGKMTLIDFGRALLLGGEDHVESAGIRGTPIYMSPELREILAKDNKYDRLIKQCEDQLANTKDKNEIKELELRIENINLQRDNLMAGKITYSAANDVYSLGVTLATMLGLAIIAKPEKRVNLTSTTLPLNR